MYIYALKFQDRQALAKKLKEVDIQFLKPQYATEFVDHVMII